MNKIFSELGDLSKRINVLNRRITELRANLLSSPSPSPRRSSPSPKRVSPVKSIGKGSTLGGMVSKRSPRSTAAAAAESRRSQYMKTQEYRNKLNAAARAQNLEKKRKKNRIMKKWKMMIKYPHYKARMLKLN